MSGIRAGGLKAAATNKYRYGLSFYTRLGRKGGQASSGSVWSRDPEAASAAGIKGARRSAEVKREKARQRKAQQV